MVGWNLLKTKNVKKKVSLKSKLGRYKCGLPGQNNTPSLMIGLAGIGYEFLKIYDSSLPSVLSLSVDK